MMASSRVWLFCSIVVIIFEQSVGQVPEAAELRISPPTLHEGISYTLTCIADQPGFVTITSYTFLVDGVPGAPQSVNTFSLTMTSSLVGSVVSCNYLTTFSTQASEPSNRITIALDPLPVPSYVRVNPALGFTLTQTSDLNCVVSSYLAPWITAYNFQFDGSGISFERSQSTSIKGVVPSQNPITSTCSYTVGQTNSSYSNEIEIVASAIATVTTMPSAIQAYYGQEVVFTCLIDLDENSTPPTFGHSYVFRWYDVNNTRILENHVPRLGVNIDSNITIHCEAAANIELFVASEPVTVTVLDIPEPSVIEPSTPLYFPGLRYTFVCNSSVPDIDSFSWVMDAFLVHTTPPHQINITMGDPPFTVSLECHANSGSFSSPLSSLIVIQSTAIPPPNILAADDTQDFVTHGHPFELICNASSVLNSYVTTFNFVGVADDGNSQNVTSPNSSYMATASQFQRYNYTCSYEIDDVVSPVSDNSYSLLATIITRVTTVPSTDQAYLGEIVTFTCQVDTDPDATPPIGGDIYTVRWFDGHGNLMAVTQEVSYALTVQSNIMGFSCHAAVNNDLFVMGAPTSVEALSLPVPSILLPASPVYFILVPHLITCNSGVQRPVAALEYEWFIFGSSQGTTRTGQQYFSLNFPSQYEFSCKTSIGSYNSCRSPGVSITMSVPPPPSIQLLAEPSHYLVGTEYELECQSNQEAFVTMFCLENFDSDAACQISKRFPFTPEENEQRLTCYLQFGSVNTTNSTFVSIIGSGIVDMTASADNLSPYPGTNVTLTCSPTLTTGYVESDVTFSWKEGARLTAQTKVASEYVTIDMVKSFECEGTTGMVDVTSNVLTITARDLPTPGMEVQNRPADDSYEPGYFYPLICNSELEDLLTSYNWYSDGQLVEDVHTKQYLAQAMSYTHVYTCTYVIVTEESPQSSSVTIATESILRVHVESNGLRTTTLMPLFDSSVAVSCEATIKPTATESPTYNWFERGSLVGTGQELAIVAYAGYNSPVVCEVTVGDDVMASNQVNITSREDLPSPEMSLTTHQANEVLPRASYTLSCISSSLSLNTTVTWYKDLSQLLCLRELTLDITRYDPVIHDGQYTCEIATLGITARSEPTTLLAIAPGKPCPGSFYCVGQGEGYTGECRDQRCVCSLGYKTRLKECVLI